MSSKQSDDVAPNEKNDKDGGDKKKSLQKSSKPTQNVTEVSQNTTGKRQRPDSKEMEIDLNPHGPKRVDSSQADKGKPKKSFLCSDPIQATASDASRKTISQLKDIYKKTIKPIEQKFGLSKFCLPTDGELEDAEIEAKPMVLLIGQYSTGKSTFVRHLVGGDFPGMHIGPEPTTDKFTALVHGEDSDENEESDEDGKKDGPESDEQKAFKKIMETAGNGKIIKGNSLTVTPELPFSGLSSFGTGFLSNFVGSVSNYPLLKHVTLVDTPGVLSGEKQRLARKYNFGKVIKWFADRSDLILLLFDAHKLDISDELKSVIETIRPQNDDKIRCVLNKADGVTREQLVRVYGSLMWSMGKVFDCPEVVRVYTGSYWDQPLLHDDFQSMFESDEWLLIHELMNLPKSSAERKVNDMVKRIRMVKVHVCILTYLKNKTPRWFGKQNARDNILQDLDKVFNAVRFEYKLSEGDMPDIKQFSKCLHREDDFSKFVSIDKKTLCVLDDLLSRDIPNIIRGAGGISNSSGDGSKLRWAYRELKNKATGASARNINSKMSNQASRDALTKVSLLFHESSYSLYVLSQDLFHLIYMFLFNLW